MFAEEILVAVCKADATIVAVIGDGNSPPKLRLSPIESTQADGLLRITWQRVSNVASASLDGNTGDLDQTRLQTDVWGRDYAQVQALAKALRDAMTAMPTRLLVSDFQDYDAEAKIYRFSQDFNIWAAPA